MAPWTNFTNAAVFPEFVIDSWDVISWGFGYNHMLPKLSSNGPRITITEWPQ